MYPGVMVGIYCWDPPAVLEVLDPETAEPVALEARPEMADWAASYRSPQPQQLRAMSISADYKPMAAMEVTPPGSEEPEVRVPMELAELAAPPDLLAWEPLREALRSVQPLITSP